MIYEYEEMVVGIRNKNANYEIRDSTRRIANWRKVWYE